MDELAIMQRAGQRARGRMTAVGPRADDGTKCAVVVVHEVGGMWAMYPHGAAQLGVRLPDSLCPEGCQGDIDRLCCPAWVRVAASCSADAGLVDRVSGALR